MRYRGRATFLGSNLGRTKNLSSKFLLVSEFWGQLEADLSF